MAKRSKKRCEELPILHPDAGASGLTVYVYTSVVSFGDQDCVPSLERDSAKEDPLHDSQFVSSMILDGWSAIRS